MPWSAADYAMLGAFIAVLVVIVWFVLSAVSFDYRRA
jgi:hypothetical protein